MQPGFDGERVRMSPPALPARMQQGAASLHELSPYDAGAESQISSISFQPQKELAESASRLYHPPKNTSENNTLPHPQHNRSLPTAAPHRAQLRARCPGWPGGSSHRAKSPGSQGRGAAAMCGEGERGEPFPRSPELRAVRRSVEPGSRNAVPRDPERQVRSAERAARSPERRTRSCPRC